MATQGNAELKTKNNYYKFYSKLLQGKMHSTIIYHYFYSQLLKGKMQYSNVVNVK